MDHLMRRTGRIAESSRNRTGTRWVCDRCGRTYNRWDGIDQAPSLEKCRATHPNDAYGAALGGR